MNTPLVSIVVPVYNASRFIHETILSVQNQTYTNWELILVNDGSKDDSLILLKSYESKDPEKYKVIDKTNSGVSETRNIGIAKARGKYIALLDADDQWLPHNLEKKINVLEQFPAIGFVFSDMNYVDDQLSHPTPAPSGKDQSILTDLLLWNGEVIPGPCSNLVIRKACFETGIKFKKNLSTIADQNLTVQLAYQFQGKRIPELLWNYRVVPGSMSKSVKVMERDCVLTYSDYLKCGYFPSRLFTLKCFSNMYLIVAGSYWKDAGDKWKAMDYLFKSFFIYPPVIFKLLQKLSK